MYDANLIVVLQNPPSKEPKHNAAAQHSEALELGST
jgi:hypothetical protein